MNTNQNTSKAYFTSLQIIYYALIAGQVMFGIICLSLIQSGKFETGDTVLSSVFSIIVPLFAIAGIFGSVIMFRNILREHENKDSLPEMMPVYRGALIVRYALLEAPSFFSIVAYLLTGEIVLLGAAGLIIIYFITIKPTIARAVKDLKLNPDDEHTLNNPEAIII